MSALSTENFFRFSEVDGGVGPGRCHEKGSLQCEKRWRILTRKCRSAAKLVVMLAQKGDARRLRTLNPRINPRTVVVEEL